MMKRISLVVLFVLAGQFAAPIAAAEVSLVQDGQPRAAIVLSADRKPNDPSHKALVSWIQRMSGAELPVLRGNDLVGAKVENGRFVLPQNKSNAETFILLGESELTKQLGFALDDVGPGGIVVQTGTNTLALLAKDDGLDNGRYPAHGRAVFRLLEELGCRFLWPGELGKVIPKKPTITVPALNIRFTPPVGQRNIRFASIVGGRYDQGLAYLGVKAEDYVAMKAALHQEEIENNWSAWNCFGGYLGIGGGHAGSGLHGGWDEFGTSHPEWFALQPDGTRDQSKAGGRWQLCVSNPALVDHVANDLIARLGGKPQAPISLSPNDGGYSNFCMCDACKKLDALDGPKIKLLVFAKVGESARTEVDYVSLTDRYLHYWNEIARRVTAVVPEQLFVVDAYSYYSDPPVREKLHPNLILRYVPNETAGWEGWQTAGAKRVFWRPNNLQGGHRQGVLRPTLRATAEKLRFFTDHGMLATDMDSIFDNWATQGLEYYVAARMSWDPMQSYDALLDDYCRSGFGAGAEQVKEYFQLVDKEIVPVVVNGRGQFPKITQQTLDQMRALLVAAGKATANDPETHRRVDFLRAGFEFTAISAEAHRLKDAVVSSAEKGGETTDLAAAQAVLERRWQMMRALFDRQPLAVNVAVVAANDRPLIDPLKWKGPSEATKARKFLLPADDDYLNEDQSATRK